MPVYLSVKELWHNRGRFLLVALVVALITTLVLFIAALAEGLGDGNREYLEKLDGELLVYQDGVDLSINSSRLGRSRLSELRRVEGVADVGQISFAATSLLTPGNSEPLDVSLIGVEPGRPGVPPAFEGASLGRNRSNEAIVDANVALRTGVEVGDTITVKSVQGTEEEFYDLTVVGITDGRQYAIQPSIFLPYLTWDKVRPRGSDQSLEAETVSNVVNVLLEDPTQAATVALRIEQEVDDVEVVDRITAYEATPGYSAQQSTLNTQRYFTLIIGLLVIGGFFQIQTLQKIAQVGMLKAIGASSFTVALAALIQIIIVNSVGVLLGASGALLLSLSFPATVPIVFTPDAVLAAVGALLIIGPLGGLVSVYALLRVEPLTALGLAQ